MKRMQSALVGLLLYLPGTDVSSALLFFYSFLIGFSFSCLVVSYPILLMIYVKVSCPRNGEGRAKRERVKSIDFESLTHDFNVITHGCCSDT